MVFLKFIALAFLAYVQGENVFHFEVDNFYTNLSYAKQIINQELSTYSICLRFQLSYFRVDGSYLFSMGIPSNTDFFIFKIQYPMPGAKLTKLHIEQADENNDGTFISIEILDDIILKWIHVCLIVNENNWRVYIDGKQHEAKQFGSFPFHKFIPKNTFLVLAKEQDSYGSDFDEKQGFAGKIAQFKLWSIAITDEAIKSEADCNVDSSETLGNVISSVSSWTINLVDIVEMAKEEFCRENEIPWREMEILSAETTWTIDFEQCEIMGGQLSQYTSNENAVELSEKFMILLDAVILRQPGNSAPQCTQSTNAGKEVLYLNIAAENRNQSWVNTYSGDKFVGYSRFFESEVSDIKLNDGISCGFMETYSLSLFGYYSRYCEESTFACSVCHNYDGLSIKWFHLKGLTKEFQYALDEEYFIYGQKNGRPLFRGTAKSELYYDKTGLWTFDSFLVKQKNYSYFENQFDFHPFGRRKLGQITVTFSQCNKTEFTCNSGHCIPIGKKCDAKMDCNDGSDEAICPVVRLPDTYKKNTAPIPENIDEPLITHVHAHILSIPSIVTMDLIFSMNFLMHLSWNDDRVVMTDLNYGHNELGEKMQNMVWYPLLLMDNVHGSSKALHLHELSNILVNKEEHGRLVNIDGAETMLYSGENNSLSLIQIISETFTCKFELYAYPFDTQHCMANFSALKGQLQFKITPDLLTRRGVTFLGDTNLVEYKIIDYYLTKGVSNMHTPQITINVIFQRRMEYHVTSTFLQTQLLILVGFMSFYFRVDNFTDRIMVTLTVALVMATIVASVQGGLPKTSYYKLIDYWLLYCLITLILTFLFHTLIGSAFDGNDIFGLKKGPNLAKKINQCGKIFVLLFIIGVNFTFWIVAIKEYLKQN